MFALGHAYAAYARAMRDYRLAVEQEFGVRDAYCLAYVRLQEAAREIQHDQNLHGCPLMPEYRYFLNVDEQFRRYFGPPPSEAERKKASQEEQWRRCGYGSFMD